MTSTDAPTDSLVFVVAPDATDVSPEQIEAAARALIAGLPADTFTAASYETTARDIDLLAPPVSPLDAAITRLEAAVTAAPPANSDGSVTLTAAEFTELTASADAVALAAGDVPQLPMPTTPTADTPTAGVDTTPPGPVDAGPTPDASPVVATDGSVFAI